MTNTQIIRAIADRIMADVPVWVEPVKVNESFARFFDELGDALKQAAPEIEGKSEAQIREILLHVFTKFCQEKLDQERTEKKL